ncbi:Dbl homology domain-containing protein [Catenaria anguillulae PL171]|uniref:Dbl homology domain-containing protein n=1 Tax=Catenaria anguillulae PL171 TaxID=765915 RepID=A0A1Y2HD31_9FUNG|nr:Dbl homology domain-containing protein [Catenaria anguillulae PL171]
MKTIHAVYELYASEHSYCQGLQTMVVRYLDPVLALEASPGTRVAHKADIQSLFANLKELLGLSSNLLKSLSLLLFGPGPMNNTHECLPLEAVTWSPFSSKSDSVETTLLPFVPFLRSFAPYLANYPKALSVLDLFSRGSKRYLPLVHFINSVHPNGVMALQALLITPVQRLPRYRLLIEAIHKACFKDEVSWNLALVLSQVSCIVDQANESIRRSESAHKLLSLQTSIVGHSISLLSPTRTLLLSANLLKVSRDRVDERYVIVFTDGILILSSIPGGRFMFHHWLSLSTVSVCATGHEQNRAFALYSSQKSFVLVAENTTVRDSWVQAIQRAKLSVTATVSLQADLTNPQGRNGRLDSQCASVQRSILLEPTIPTVDNYMAPIWTPDAESATCQRCQVAFSPFARRRVWHSEAVDEWEPRETVAGF